MIWNDHKNLEGLHAFLGASNYHWLNWNESSFELRYQTQYSAEVGTLIHELAKSLILSNIKVNFNDKNLINYHLFQAGIPSSVYDTEFILSNLVPFVNDAIGFRMTPEVILYYSPECFGTTDAIAYNEKKKTLRIHDLKTGVTVAKPEQLMIYAALFCLEYKIKPNTLDLIELRIYQNGEVAVYNPTSDDINNIMNLIISRTALVQKIKERNRLM